MEIHEIINMLEVQLDSYRFKHSVNVMKMSEDLARHYEVDVEKAKLAGILHDCGKNYEGDEAREYVRKIGYQANDIEMLQPKLLHGVIGENLARVMYDVNDQEILGAIRWHITGKAGMNPLEKIIYVADYIEPSRDFEAVKDMRRLAFEDLDKCVLFCSESTISFILNNGFLLHEKTIETRNYSLMLINNWN